jgi:hypothetical protein
MSFYWNVNRWRSCLQNVSYVFPENDVSIMAAYFAYVYARWVYAHLFNMFALYSLGRPLRVFEVKVFILLYFVV